MCQHTNLEGRHIRFLITFENSHLQNSIATDGCDCSDSRTRFPCLPHSLSCSLSISVSLLPSLLLSLFRSPYLSLSLHFCLSFILSPSLPNSLSFHLSFSPLL